MTLKTNNQLTESQVSEVIQMALSDQISFKNIKLQYGLAEKDVKVLMLSLIHI